MPEIEQCLHWTRGRAFVLFTSYRVHAGGGARLGPRLPYPGKTQEELPRQKLIEWFKATPNSVLFATATFWEGVDVPGDALSCVIIDKLPFASPGRPGGAGAHGADEGAGAGLVRRSSCCPRRCWR